MGKVAEWKKELDSIEKQMDLKLRFPGYFHKYIFRIAFVLVAVLLVAVIFENGFEFRNVYYECPKNTAGVCHNPFYVCRSTRDRENESFIFSDTMCLKDTDQYLCDLGFCNAPTLQPGEVIGNKPGILFQSFNLLMVVILGLAFVVNHLVYFFETGKWKYSKEDEKNDSSDNRKDR